MIKIGSYFNRDDDRTLTTEAGRELKAKDNNTKHSLKTVIEISFHSFSWIFGCPRM